MSAAFIEHRPMASDPKAATVHHAVVANGKELKTFKTQREAAEWAKLQGYAPVHVARERHLQNRDVPDHWRLRLQTEVDVFVGRPSPSPAT
jgi:hypothetical protein